MRSKVAVVMLASPLSASDSEAARKRKWAVSAADLRLGVLRPAGCFVMGGLLT